MYNNFKDSKYLQKRGTKMIEKFKKDYLRAKALKDFFEENKVKGFKVNREIG